MSLVLDSSTKLAWIFGDATTEAIRRLFDEVADTFGNDGYRSRKSLTTHLPCDGAQRGTVEVVHVCVTQQHGIDARQVT